MSTAKHLSLAAVAALCLGLQAQAQEVQSFSVPPFAQSGQTVEASLSIQGTVPKVELEVVEFHYFHHPQLAPETDTWPHDRQMAHMKQVVEGKAEAYRPSLDDPKVARILSMMPKRRLSMERQADGSYKARWTAGHGRFFLRPLLDGQPAPMVESLRVHCDRPRLDVIRNLASLVRNSRQALSEGQSQRSQDLLAQTTQAFNHGHGLRFMLTHHGWDPSPLESALENARRTLESREEAQASAVLADLLENLQTQEKRFSALDLSTQ